MAVRIARLGSARTPGEGLRLGTVRRPPRGVRKEDFARRDFYDLWFPELAPSAKLVSWLFAQPITETRWTTFSERYRREMKAPTAERVLELLSRLSHQADFSVGCYCEDEAHCHRSLLRALLAERGAELATPGESSPR